MPVPKVPKPFTHNPPEVEIVAVPQGDAPDWVRQAWVGLVLPLAAPDVHKMEVVGVLSGPRTWVSYWIWRLTRQKAVQSGYLIETLKAVDIVGQKNPDAADWWRKNVSHLMIPDHTLLFEAHVCRPVTHPPPKAANQ